jgi:hypothetical protein
LVGFVLTKIAINRTESIWYEYELELREHLELHSPFGDGLSFGQASPAGRPFTSTKFASHYEKHEPYDSIIFGDGALSPGESAIFNVVVTDTTPDPHFYLMQRREQQIVRMPVGGQLVAASPTRTRHHGSFRSSPRKRGSWGQEDSSRRFWIPASEFVKKLGFWVGARLQDGCACPGSVSGTSPETATRRLPRGLLVSRRTPVVVVT